jgi:hypothetical protein
MTDPLASIALCIGLSTTPPIIYNTQEFHRVCVTQWKKTGHTFSQPVACTDGFRVITPDYGASDFVIAHEMAHIAGYISESAADTAAMMCLEKVK